MSATRMPRAARLFLAGNTVSMTGTGLVIAFTFLAISCTGRPR